MLLIGQVGFVETKHGLYFFNITTDNKFVNKRQIGLGQERYHDNQRIDVADIGPY